MQNDGDLDPTLAEVARAIMNVLEECHAELALLKQREEDGPLLEEDSPDVRPDNGGDDSSEEQILRVAKRLEAAAGALREATSENP